MNLNLACEYFKDKISIKVKKKRSDRVRGEGLPVEDEDTMERVKGLLKQSIIPVAIAMESWKQRKALMSVTGEKDIDYFVVRHTS